MSVLIKGLHKPDKNHGCPFVDAEYGYCLVDLGVTGKGEKCERMKECPLIELPDHGDLIDKNELMKRKQCVYKFGEYKLYAVDTDTILDMPVVIPAERNESPCDDCDYRSDAGCSWCRRYERSEDDSRENELISICSQKGVAWDDEVFYNELHQKQEMK